MPTLYKALDQDPSGLLGSHRFVGEFQKVIGGYKALIRPNYGSFFKESFILYSVASVTSRTRLIEGVDYLFAHLDTEATSTTGKEVFNAVIVLNTLLPSLYQIDYQAYGGDANFNLAAIGEAIRLSKIGIASDYKYVVNPPTHFPPEEHTHDIADVYGFDVFSSFLDGIKEACVFNKTGGSNKVLTDRIAAFGKATKDAKIAVAIGVREHLDLMSFPHVYTKQDLGLSNVANLSFTGLPENKYASPLDLKLLIDNLPTPEINNHSNSRTNPHNVTPLQVGLGAVSNHPVLTNYSPLSGTAQTLFAENAVEVYFTPFVAVTAVQQGAALKYNQAFGDMITATVQESLGKLNDANQLLLGVDNKKVFIAQKSTALQLQRSTIVQATQRAKSANKRYTIVHGNSVLSKTLQAITSLEYANSNAGFSTYPNGFFSDAPLAIDDLVCWLSVNQPKNNMFTDMNGAIRLTKLVDLSNNGYEFSAALPSTAPIYGPGYDKLNGLSGIISSDVIRFSPGQYLDQSKGKPLFLKPGMTLIAVTRTGPTGTKMDLLTNPMKSEFTGWTVQSEDGRSVIVRSGGPWKPIIAPLNSAAYNASGIVVASISPTTESECWVASTVGINRTLYPRGVNTPVSNWPSLNFEGAQLTRVGNSNFGIKNQGELVDLLIYDRQLSFAEVQAITHYLKLRASKNTALSVDFRAADAFV